MALITEIIPSQEFELVRDRVAEILIDELANQAALSYDEDLEVNVFVERSIPFDKTELPAINVSLAQGEFDNKKAPNLDGNYIYNIDVHTSAKSNEEDQGDSRASVKLHKILGKCRAIIENPIYRTLGFNKPSISRVFFSQMDIADPGKQDALNTQMGRLILNVRVPEGVSLLAAGLIEGYDTKVKIGTSSVGYAYIGENY